jgi:putative ABC transport system permease protein
MNIRNVTPFGGMGASYFKTAFRNLVRNKTYVGINVVGLALSISCCILIFTLVKYHLSFDNFHQNSDRIYRIVTEMHRDNIGYNSNVPTPLGKVFRDDYNFGEKVGRISTFENQIISLKNGKDIKKIKEENGVSFTENEFFEIFNYPLLQGNFKTVFEKLNAAVLTEKIATKYFGDAAPIGKQFILDNRITLTVTGILKNLPENTDLKSEIFVSYITLKQYNDWLGSEKAWGGIQDGQEAYTRLRPNISVAQVERVFPAYVKKFRPTSKNVHHYKLQTLADIHFNAQYGGAMEMRNLWILSIIGLFLMVSACVNFINLSTAQALKRSKEVGVRKVLGGQKFQLFWQFIAETSLIVVFGIVLAFAFSYLILPFANNFFQSKMTINLFTDYYLALFILALGVFVTFLSGSYPGLILAGFQPVVALKGKLSQQSIGGFNTRRSLIVTQFAISQVLIIGIIVIMSQIKYAKNSDLGFDKEAMIMIPVGADSTGLVIKTLKNQFLQIPGVEKVSLCIDAPASADAWNTSIGFGNQAEEVNFRTNMKSADEDYLETFGLELVAGKNIFASDTVREFLVNEALTRKLGLKSPKDAIGKMITADGGSMFAPIVGIVKDFHERSFHEEIGAVAIMTHKEDYANFAVKINLANAKTILPAIEQMWTAKFPEQIFEYQFLDENIAKFYETESRFLTLIQFFSLIAIFIGCLGLYGLVSFMVIQKTKEIGIRKVLGSTISQIVWIFGKEFSKLILIAFIIAAPIAWYLMNLWLQDFEYKTKISSVFFAYAIASSFMVAALTVGYQSIRAALMNPVESLKTE